jgi:hypothetical protein
VSGSSFSQGVPAQSITLYVLAPGGRRKPRRRPGVVLRSGVAAAGVAASGPASVLRLPPAPAPSR